MVLKSILQKQSLKQSLRKISSEAAVRICLGVSQNFRNSKTPVFSTKPEGLQLYERESNTAVFL